MVNKNRLLVTWNTLSSIVTLHDISINDWVENNQENDAASGCQLSSIFLATIVYHCCEYYLAICIILMEDGCLWADWFVHCHLRSSWLQSSFNKSVGPQWKCAAQLCCLNVCIFPSLPELCLDTDSDIWH